MLYLFFNSILLFLLQGNALKKCNETMYNRKRASVSEFIQTNGYIFFSSLESKHFHFNTFEGS